MLLTKNLSMCSLRLLLCSLCLYAFYAMSLRFTPSCAFVQLVHVCEAVAHALSETLFGLAARMTWPVVLVTAGVHHLAAPV